LPGRTNQPNQMWPANQRSIQRTKPRAH